MRHNLVAMGSLVVLLAIIVPTITQDAYANTCPDPNQTFNSKAPPVITSIVPTTDGAVVTWTQAQLHFHLFFFIQGCTYPILFEVEGTTTSPVTAPFEFQYTGIAGGSGGVFTITGLQPNTTYYVDVDGVWATPAFGGFIIDGVDSSFTTLALPDPVPLKKKSGGCDNCQAPSIGVTDKGKRVVDGGLTVNGQTVDAEYYKTPFKLIQVPLGKKVTMQFVIWDDRANNIAHIELQLGKGKIGESFSKDSSMIWERHVMTKEVTIQHDSMFKDVKMEMLGTAPCTTESTDQKCDLFQVTFTPTEAIVGDVVFGLNIWDDNRNAGTTFFNDGLQIGTEADVIPEQSFVIVQGTGNRPVDNGIDPTDQRWTDGFKKHYQEYTEQMEQLAASKGY